MSFYWYCWNCWSSPFKISFFNNFISKGIISAYLPEHMGSPPIFSEVRVTRSLVLWVMFCRSLFVLLSFFFRLVGPLIYRFWLPLWYLWFTDSDYPFGIFDLQILITSLVSSKYSCGSTKYRKFQPPYFSFSEVNNGFQ